MSTTWHAVSVTRVCLTCTILAAITLTEALWDRIDEKMDLLMLRLDPHEHRSTPIQVRINVIARKQHSVGVVAVEGSTP